MLIDCHLVKTEEEPQKGDQEKKGGESLKALFIFPMNIVKLHNVFCGGKDKNSATGSSWIQVRMKAV